MIPEIGHYALILALCVSLALTVLPLLGAQRNNVLLMHTGRSLSVGLFALTCVAFACRVYAFIQDDFSVAYVASNSNSLLPAYYKVSAGWGGHEGSLLLWVLVVAGCTLP